MKEDINDKNKTIETKRIEFYFWIHSVFRKYIEVTMDLILVGLVFVTFIFVVKSIYLLAIAVYRETNISLVIAELLFIFILVEVIRILVIYIELHHISVDIMVELAIVAILREIILKGAIEIETVKIVGLSLLIVVLGLLLRFSGIRKQTGDVVSIYKPFFKSKKQMRHTDL